jgi:hypothetical protein
MKGLFDWVLKMETEEVAFSLDNRIFHEIL